MKGTIEHHIGVNDEVRMAWISSSFLNLSINKKEEGAGVNLSAASLATSLVKSNCEAEY